jgi:hypothetical protein
VLKVLVNFHPLLVAALFSCSPPRIRFWPGFFSMVRLIMSSCSALYYPDLDPSTLQAAARDTNVSRNVVFIPVLASHAVRIAVSSLRRCIFTPRRMTLQYGIFSQLALSIMRILFVIIRRISVPYELTGVRYAILKISTYSST